MKKDIESIKNQLEIKNAISEINNALEGINKSKEEIKRYLETNENEDKTIQNL